MVSAVLREARYFSPIGQTARQVVESLRSGRSGIRALEDTRPVLNTGAISLPEPGHQDERELHPRLSARYTRVLAAFLESVRDLLSGCGPVDRVYLICKRPFFSKWRAAEEFDEARFIERVFERCQLELDPARVYTLQAACSSGLLALNYASRDLARGSAGRILLLGLQAELNAEKFVSFKKLGALSSESDPRRSCQPFCRGRSGLVPGEVAVALLLEGQPRPGAGDIVVRPGAASSDGARLTDCLEDGRYLEECLSRSLAGCPLEDLDFICPHGTSTPLNDRVEGTTLDRFFSARRSPIYVAPLKQYVGHTLVSSGLWETALMAEQLRHNFLPPVLHPAELERYPHLRFPETLVETPLHKALKVSVGFGGINAALVLEKAR